MLNSTRSVASSAEQQEVCARFASFLRAKKEQICETWLAEVRRDVGIPTTEELSDPLLLDHVPRLLDSLCDALAVHEVEAISAAAEVDARQHGTQRYRQGFRLDELIRELANLRTVLIRCLGDFGVEESRFIGNAQTSTTCRLHHFLDEFARWSTVRFVHEQKDLLRRSNESLLNVLRGVCHELGNSLNAIGLSAELLVIERPSPVKEVKEGIRRGIQFMRRMLRDLQELADLAGGKITVTASPFAPSALAAEVASAYEAVARAKGLQLSFTSDPTLSILVTDEHRLKQVALRLVSNAINYTQSGEIKFEVRDVDAERWGIAVSDTGAGIAPEFQKKVFEEFFRVAQTSGAEGAGLGLAFTIRLVQLLEGEATLESQPGKGTRVEVVLPKVFKSA